MSQPALLTAEEILTLFALQPLPGEGGYYRETYRSSDRIPRTALAARYGTDKAAGTAIYYLLTPENFSALHRLPTDEIYHFYLGSSVHMLQLLPDGTGRRVVLGPDLRAGQHVQLVVPREVWQGSYLAPDGSYALLGTTMAPGFDFADFEAGDRERLSAQYPAFAEDIGRLT